MLITLIEIILTPAIYLGCILLKFLLNYSYYFFGFLLLRIGYKFLHEVYNGHLKLQPSSDQAILITGGTSGIGLSLSKYFHKQGYSVIVGYYSKQEPGYDELMKLNEKVKGGNSLYFVNLNVRSQESISDSYKLVSKLVTDNELKLHALINNAGVGRTHKSVWESPRHIQSLIETNLMGPILMVRQYLPLLAKAPNSRIVNVSSLVSYLPVPLCATYGATKAGLAYYTNTLSMEIDGYKVRSVTIYPGNLMRNTAILSGCSSDTNDMYEQFSGEEKELFGEEFKRHQAYVQGVDSRIKRALERDSTESTKNKTGRSAGGNSYAEHLGKFLELLMGNVPRGLKLEESEFMDSFDNAIRMRNPPMEMFAGNRLFNIVSCAMMETMGHWTRRNIALILAKIGISASRR